MLKQSGIVVHSLYVHKDAASCFDEISTFTGGRSGFLNINSQAGAELLTDLVANEILRKIGD